ncbi:unnamed protein product [Peniophora sp. CBMAI 1063]|nr:unnamed protein product [Peniophora sp. CBMAI 1063]
MAPVSPSTTSTQVAVLSTTPTPFIFGTTIAILALLTIILALLALILRLQALQLRRRTRPRVQSPPAVARVPVFFAAPTRSASGSRGGGKKRDTGRHEDKGASRGTSPDDEVEEVELNVLEYGPGGGGGVEPVGSAL